MENVQIGVIQVPAVFAVLICSVTVPGAVLKVKGSMLRAKCRKELELSANCSWLGPLLCMARNEPVMDNKGDSQQ